MNSILTSTTPYPSPAPLPKEELPKEEFPKEEASTPQHPTFTTAEISFNRYKSIEV